MKQKKKQAKKTPQNHYILFVILIPYQKDQGFWPVRWTAMTKCLEGTWYLASSLVSQEM